jgi:DNA-directed RNA polymerase subunit alpha
MDADFSPVKTVNFRVEPAKRKPGAERLVLELWTNGSVSPEDAVGEAALILEDHFNLLCRFPSGPETEESVPTEISLELNENLFGASTSPALRPSLQPPEDGEHPYDRRPRAEDEAELLKTKNFGKKSSTRSRQPPETNQSSACV